MRARNLAAVAMAGALLTVSCGGDDGADVRQIGGSTGGSSSATAECTPVGNAMKARTTVNVTLDEYSIAPDSARVAAGSVHFAVENAGSAPHEMVVARAASPRDLPVGADGRVSEDGIAKGALIGEVGAFPAGQTCDATFTLRPGAYVLFCNLLTAVHGREVSHFREGMATTFRVAG